jgi:hypothetical protein
MSHATMSRDGRPRLTFRTEVRLDHDDLTACLAYALVRTLAGFDLDDWTPEDRHPGRARIENAARAAMRWSGVEAYAYWRDDLDGSDADPDEVEAWCIAAVRRRFPELFRDPRTGRALP